MKETIDKARTGDVVCVDRGLYRHYGVYDNGNVIDISPDGGDNSLANKHNAIIRKRSLNSFLNGDQGYVDNSLGFFSREKTVKRARAEIGTGKDSYNLIFNNCEHKAREWQTSRKESGQVEDVINIIACLISRIFG